MPGKLPPKRNHWPAKRTEFNGLRERPVKPPSPEDLTRAEEFRNRALHEKTPVEAAVLALMAAEKQGLRVSSLQEAIQVIREPVKRFWTNLESAELHGQKTWTRKEFEKIIARQALYRLRRNLASEIRSRETMGPQGELFEAVWEAFHYIIDRPTQSAPDFRKNLKPQAIEIIRQRAIMLWESLGQDEKTRICAENRRKALKAWAKLTEKEKKEETSKEDYVKKSGRNAFVGRVKGKGTMLMNERLNWFFSGFGNGRRKNR